MADNRIQVKRTSVSGRIPNTSNIANSSYIAPGEFALNMADGILYTSNGSSAIIIGAAQKDVTANSVTSNSISSNTVSVSGAVTVSDVTSTLSINSTSVFVGNGTTNTTVNTTIVAVASADSNVMVFANGLFAGNSTINTSIDLIGGSTSVNIANISMTSEGLVTVRTSTNHNISTSVQSTIVITGTSNPLFNSNSYISGDTTFVLDTVPTANTFTFKLGPSTYSSMKTDTISRNIQSISRSNGVVTVTTSGPHNLSTGDVITIVDSFLTKWPMTTSGSTITTTSSISFTYPNGVANKIVDLTSATFSIPAISTTSSGNVVIRINKTNTFSVGDVITVSNPTVSGSSRPNQINVGTQWLPIDGVWTLTAANSSSFSYRIGTKAARVTGFSLITGSLTGGNASYTQDETGKPFGAYVYQVITNSSPGGSIKVDFPRGLSVKAGTSLLRIMPQGIYVGNTTIGGFTGPGGFKIQKP